jgi:uncharacterized membrane protein
MPDLKLPGLSDNTAAGIAYLTCIPAIVLLIVEPYRRSPFVRFHAWQSIFFFLTLAGLEIILGAALSFVPYTGILLTTLWQLASLALFLVWIIVIIAAFGGRRVSLPVLGALAEKQANR